MDGFRCSHLIAAGLLFGVFVAERPEVSLAGNMMIAHVSVGLEGLVGGMDVASAGGAVGAYRLVLAADDFVAFGGAHRECCYFYY